LFDCQNKKSLKMYILPGFIFQSPLQQLSELTPPKDRISDRRPPSQLQRTLSAEDRFGGRRRGERESIRTLGWNLRSHKGDYCGPYTYKPR
jgi:hypothetical protein